MAAVNLSPQNENKSRKKVSSKNLKHHQDLAPKFKYKVNSPNEDIEKVRELLALDRKKQCKEEFEFWRPDYERMLKDDWLVSRFLLRGSKAAQKFAGSGQLISMADDPMLAQTMKLVRACAKFRRDYRVNGLTSESEFPQDWIKVNGLFNFRPDLAGNPTIYLRSCLHKPKLINTNESRHEFKRFLLYTLEKCDQDLYNNMGKGVCCIFDLSDATLDNIDLELVSWMIKSFKSCSPKLLAYVIIYNLPWFFSATFRLLTTSLMMNMSKQCLHFVYGAEILQYIDYNNLPEYIRDTL